jgi:hypothetical protein
MKKFCGTFSAGLIACGLLVALAACQRQEGPAERAGRDLDKAMEKTGQQIEKAGEQIRETAKDGKR